jgi:DNA polymerase-3 subunit alpha
MNCRDVNRAFAHLHVHTDASRIDGLGTVENLVARAKELGMPSLAMTDHGSLTNTIAFMSACKLAGIKPIVGVEGYVAVDSQIFHITLLANGKAGFNSLVNVNNAGQHSSFSKPAFSIDDLVKNNDGLYILTGCIASPFQALPLPDAVEIGRYLLPHFSGRMFAETMAVGNYRSWVRSMELAERLGIPPVVTNDVHFTKRELAPVHKVLTNLKAGFEYQSAALYMATPEEILARVSNEADSVKTFFVRGIDNAGRLAARLQPPEFSSEPALPTVDGSAKVLRDMCYDRVKANPAWRDNKELLTRLEYELSVIHDFGYETYFIILCDIVDFAKRSGIRVGPGRGSAAGSLVLYVLGVTDVNPLQFGLSFERFLNPERKGMPDVDVDFDSEGRAAVIEYAEKRWGGKSVATYARYSHKTLVHDLCKYYGIDRVTESKVAEGGPESDAFIELSKNNPDFAFSYNAIIGQIKSIGKHAGGIIITDVNVPLERAAGEHGLVAAWTEGDERELSSVGVVKYDLLGLSALTVLKRLEAAFGKHASDPTPDDPVFELFRLGKLAGIFQFSGSQGIVDYTRRVAPRTFDDLVAINALYRPGALDAGTAELYPAWRQSPRTIHPLIDDIIAPTFGAIVYQEQVMAIVSRLTGGSLGKADEARRIIVKSKVGDPEWTKAIGELGTEFIDGAVSRGVPADVATHIWDELKAHARYSFNRAHAVSYAKIAWELAWWRYHHPAEFFAETINSDTPETLAYLYAAVEAGLEVSPPNVNYSGEEWVAKDQTLYMPLTSVKFLGQPAAEAIIANRPYATVEEFNKKLPPRLVRSNVKESLALIGALDGLDGDIGSLIKHGDSRSVTERQVAVFGFPLPSKDIVDKIQAVRKGGWVAGVVREVERRESRYGPYFVYRLAPEGAFWIRSDTQTYEKGQLVSARVKADSGKAIAHGVL